MPTILEIILNAPPTDWSLWDGSSDGSEVTVRTGMNQFGTGRYDVLMFDSTTGVVQYTADASNGSPEAYRRPFTISGNTVSLGTEQSEPEPTQFVALGKSADVGTDYFMYFNEELSGGTTRAIFRNYPPTVSGGTEATVSLFSAQTKARPFLLDDGTRLVHIGTDSGFQQGIFEITGTTSITVTSRTITNPDYEDDSTMFYVGTAADGYLFGIQSGNTNPTIRIWSRNSGTGNFTLETSTNGFATTAAAIEQRIQGYRVSANTFVVIYNHSSGEVRARVMSINPTTYANTVGAEFTIEASPGVNSMDTMGAFVPEDNVLVWIQRDGKMRHMTINSGTQTATQSVATTGTDLGVIATSFSNNNNFQSFVPLSSGSVLAVYEGPSESLRMRVLEANN